MLGIPVYAGQLSFSSTHVTPPSSKLHFLFLRHNFNKLKKTFKITSNVGVAKSWVFYI